MQITLRADDGNMVTFARATEALGSEVKAHAVYRRAINHAGRKGETQVRRTLAKAVGLTQRRTVDLGHLRSRGANFRSLAYTVQSSGRTLSLKYFGARQFGYGVRAKPWGTSRRFESAFIFAGHPKSGDPVAGGHVFTRVSGRSLPIRKMWGPSIPREMLEEETVRAWENVALKALPGRVAHELGRLTNGIVGR